MEVVVWNVQNGIHEVQACHWFRVHFSLLSSNLQLSFSNCFFLQVHNCFMPCLVFIMYLGVVNSHTCYCHVSGNLWLSLSLLSSVLCPFLLYLLVLIVATIPFSVSNAVISHHVSLTFQSHIYLMLFLFLQEKSLTPFLILQLQISAIRGHELSCLDT